MSSGFWALPKFDVSPPPKWDTTYSAAGAVVIWKIACLVIIWTYKWSSACVHSLDMVNQVDTTSVSVSQLGTPMFLTPCYLVTVHFSTVSLNGKALSKPSILAMFLVKWHHWVDATIPQADFPVSTCPDASGRYWTVSRQGRATVARVERNGVWQTTICVTVATMSHIVDSCPPTQLNSSSRLHTTDEAVVDCLTLAAWLNG